MELIKATIDNLDDVCNITYDTINEIYPSYYPSGAVEYFLNHHREDTITNDINDGLVYLLKDCDTYVGTVTIKGNEINRLFVLPIYQHKGYGSYLLDYAEKEILNNYKSIALDSSLPAKEIYLNRGYSEVEYNKIETPNGDFLCYDVMVKNK